jgi:hypothetical protein
MNERSKSRSIEEPIYVGYLATPPKHRRFLIRLIPVMIFGAAALAATLSFSQRDPGAGVWDASSSVFTGLLLEHPYPMLVSLPSGDSEIRTVSLLVQQGKHGAKSRTAGLDGAVVRIAGSSLHRDDRQVIEISADANAVQVLSHKSQPDALRKVTMESATFHGEIIDPKCYLGAMKPGDGKTHKVCATLCITGGIPPMLVTHDALGKTTYYLLTTSTGTPANDLVTPFIGVPVSITGAVQMWGNLRVLITDVDSIHRL